MREWANFVGSPIIAMLLAVLLSIYSFGYARGFTGKQILKFFEDWVRPGAKVKMGQKLGVLGKEGGSGGWTHLHFDVTKRQPSGQWGIEDAYAFLWEAYMKERAPKLVAVARPHHLIWAGQKATLDASRSWGQGLKFEWTFTEGGTAEKPKVERTYEKPGVFAEILKITDADGRVDYERAQASRIWRMISTLFENLRFPKLARSFSLSRRKRSIALALAALSSRMALTSPWSERWLRFA